MNINTANELGDSKALSNNNKGIVYTSCLIAFYESEKQGQTVLSVCNDSRRIQQVKDKLRRESTSMVRSIGDYQALSTVYQDNNYVIDLDSRKITAVIPLPEGIEASYAETVTDSLYGFIRELHRAVLANIILDKMPIVGIEDKERALFYLEMFLDYNGGNGEFIQPIDWFDIRRLWKQSNYFRFYPTFSAKTITDLADRLLRTIEGRIYSKEKRCVVMFDVPQVSNEVMAGIQKVMAQMYELGYLPLWGLRCNHKQKRTKALLCLMEA